MKGKCGANILLCSLKLCTVQFFGRIPTSFHSFWVAGFQNKTFSSFLTNVHFKNMTFPFQTDNHTFMLLYHSTSFHLASWKNLLGFFDIVYKCEYKCNKTHCGHTQQGQRKPWQNSRIFQDLNRILWDNIHSSQNMKPRCPFASL